MDTAANRSRSFQGQQAIRNYLAATQLSSKPDNRTDAANCPDITSVMLGKPVRRNQSLRQLKKEHNPTGVMTRANTTARDSPHQSTRQGNSLHAASPDGQQRLFLGRRCWTDSRPALRPSCEATGAAPS